MSENPQHDIPARFNDAQTVPFTFQQHYWRGMIQPDDRLNRFDAAFAMRLSGPLNTELLRRSLQEVIGRHESLRARILIDDMAPRQYVDAPRDYELKIIRMDTGPGYRPETARPIVDAFANRRCELAIGPLFDALLLKFSERDHLLAWGANHFISDGFSFNLMFRELWLLYSEFLRNRPSPLKPLPAQFSDYQLWQRSTHRVWLQEHQSYWKHRLAGAAGIRWPTDTFRSEVTRGAVARVPISFSDALSIGLRAVTQRAHTMLSLGVLAVYVAVISRWCNQEDFVVETLASGRDRLEHRYIVGFLAHCTYLRMQLTGDESFIDLLNQVNQEYCRTIFRKDFGGLVNETPELLSDTYFQWLSWGFEGVGGIPTQSEATEIHIKGELFPFERADVLPDNLKFGTALWNTSDGIRGAVWYREDLFSADTVERFVESLRTTAERFVENPCARVSKGIL